MEEIPNVKADVVTPASSDPLITSQVSAPEQANEIPMLPEQCDNKDQTKPTEIPAKVEDIALKSPGKLRL